MPAPIVLFTFNRPTHTQRTLRALADNVLAPESDLHIFCDGPRGERDADKVEEVRAIVKAVRGFHSLSIVERTENRGLARSVIAGVTEVLAKHGRAVVLEDDLVTAPSFLPFMNAALDRYERNPRVFSVTGFSQRVAPPRSYAYDAYFYHRCSSFGWGTWRDRWEQVDWELADWPHLRDDVSFQRLLGLGGRDLLRMMELQRQGRIDSWAIRFCIAHTRAKALCLYPVRSRVLNIGMDASGVHTRRDKRLEYALPSERTAGPFHFPDEVCVQQPFLRQRLEFHRGPLRARLGAMVQEARDFVAKHLAPSERLK